MASNHATVKSVISGDTLILIGKASASGPPQEITVTLASIQSPRISRGPQQIAEDPFAFESKEFLRNLVIGKPVTFRIVYVVTSINKYFGDVDILDPVTGESKSLAKLIISSGWAAVKDSRDGKNSPIHDELIQLESIAKECKLGMFATDPKVIKAATRQLTEAWTPTAAAIGNLLKKYKDVPTKAIIEYVRDGASFRVYIVPECVYISFSLAGVLAPRIGNANANTTGTEASATAAAPAPASVGAELYALQSKHFTELRMLNREILIIMESLDPKSSVIFGTIIHPKGNIAIELLKNGLARISDRSISTMKKESVVALLQAEQLGRNNRRFIWESYEEPRQLTLKGPRVIEGYCTEIVSGDAIMIQPINPAAGESADDTAPLSSTDEEVKIILSSVRAPKLAQMKGSRLVSASEPWAAECKEYLRSRLIGKLLTVHIDYERTTINTSDDSATAATEEKEVKASTTRIYGTVQLSDKLNVRSIGCQLVSEGLAVCTRHRRDEPRSSEFDAMQIMEAEANMKGKGVHSKESPVLTLSAAKLNDLSTDGKRAKEMFHLLPKGSERVLKGVVEYVFSGARFKISIPSEQCIIQLALNQVRCPLGARGSGSGANGSVTTNVREAEPFSEEAKKFSRMQLNQRAVEVVIEDIDKNGVFLGRLYTLSDAPTTAGASGGEVASVNTAVTAKPTNSVWSSLSSAAVGGSVNGTSNKKRVPYACLLVSAGLARLDKYATERAAAGEKAVGDAAAMDSFKNLLDIQQAAKESKQGLWSLESNNLMDDLEEDVGELDGLDSGLDGSGGVSASNSHNELNQKTMKWGLGSLIEVQVSEIVDGVTFYVHETEKLPQLQAITEELSAYATAATPIGEAGISGVSKGQLMAVCYVESSEPSSSSYWCRAKVDDILTTGGKSMCNVTFIDYGNKSQVETASLTSLSEASSKLKTTVPLAQACKLAFLRPPGGGSATSGSSAGSSDNDWFGPLHHMSGCLLHDLTWGKKMKAFILGVETESSSSNEKTGGYGGHNGRKPHNNSASSIKLSYVALYPESYLLEHANANSSLSFPSFHSTSYNALESEESDTTAPTATSGTNNYANANVLSVNEEILNEGLATLSSKALRAMNKGGTRKNSKVSVFISNVSMKYMEKLESAQKLAHKQHLNLFRYGDPGDEDDDDFGEDGNSGNFKGSGSSGGMKTGEKDGKTSGGTVVGAAAGANKPPKK